MSQISLCAKSRSKEGTLNRPFRHSPKSIYLRYLIGGSVLAMWLVYSGVSLRVLDTPVKMGLKSFARGWCSKRCGQQFVEAGHPFGLAPIGLGARDTLRLEARMHLYGNDMNESRTPYEAALGWSVDLNKGDFIGRDLNAEP